MEIVLGIPPTGPPRWRHTAEPVLQALLRPAQPLLDLPPGQALTSQPPCLSSQIIHASKIEQRYDKSRDLDAPDGPRPAYHHISGHARLPPRHRAHLYRALSR